MNAFTATERTRVNRVPQRSVYDRETVYRILDAGLVCHLGFIAEGTPVVIPTGYGRKDNTLYVHGSAVSRTMRALESGMDVCVNVTLLDGLVLARSAFHHSMNYRSVVIFGRASLVQDSTEKIEALRVLVEHVVPGRWAHVRPPSPQELKATSVLAIPLEEVSAKVRTGPPLDDDANYALPVWAGVLPLRLTPGEPVADERLGPAIEVPDYIRDYARP